MRTYELLSCSKRKVFDHGERSRTLVIVMLRPVCANSPVTATLLVEANGANTITSGEISSSPLSCERAQPVPEGDAAVTAKVGGRGTCRP